MIKLIIKRDNTYPDLLRDYQVLINNKNKGKISNNSVIEFENVAINSSVQLQIDWCYSNKVILNQSADDTFVFLAKPACSGWKIIFYPFYITFLKNNYIILERIAKI